MSVSGQGRAVILIHGLAASGHDWERVHPYLLAAGFQIITLDLPGHGMSQRFAYPEDYHIRNLTACLENWFDQLKLVEPCLLVGHSLGGYLAMHHVIHHPELVAGLVLIDPLFSPDQLPPPVHWLLRRPDWITAAVRRTPPWLVNLSLRLDPGLNSHTPDSFLEKISTDYYRTDPEFAFLGRDIPDLEPHLGQIQLPVCIIWGRQDPTLHPVHFSRLVTGLPHAAGFALNKCGHQPHIVYPRQVADLILKFIQDIPDFNPHPARR